MANDTWKEARILIVDDEPANVLLLSTLLMRQGYQDLHEILDANQITSAIQRIEPDLVLLDIHMPQRTGLEVLREIREQQAPHHYLPVLVLTADATLSTKRQALDAGADDFLTKPFDATEVFLRVRNLLATRSMHVQMDARVRERTHAFEQAQIEILERLAQAAEFRDDDTGQHTRRVGELSAGLASALGMTELEVALIRRAAPLHDVGKIAVPDAILLKPGRLTGDEFGVMKQHTVAGGQMLSDGKSDLLRMAEQIALAHHERWDGSGYPNGLRGDEIPPAARIVSLADVADALSHDRPYRRAWPREKVLAEIRGGIGSHFDPDMARAFLSLI